MNKTYSFRFERGKCKKENPFDENVSARQRICVNIGETNALRVLQLCLCANLKWCVCCSNTWNLNKICMIMYIVMVGFI